MRANVKPRRRDGGVSGEDGWPAFDLSWHRHIYRVLANPDSRDGAHWLARLPEARIRFFDPEPSGEWAFVGRETPVRGSAIYGHESGRPLSAETVNVYRLSWPSEGIFVAAQPDAVDEYEPLEVAAEILLDVQRTAKKETAETLTFVNRWGLLGVGIPGAEDFPTDGVQRTAEELRELARWMAVVHALQERPRGTKTWSDVASLFQKRLAGVHLQARVTRHPGLMPSFHVPRLIDGLYLELWNVATGGKHLRRCKRCEDFFIRGREDQIFCTSRCARLWHVKRWKQQHRKQRHTARQSRQQRG